MAYPYLILALPADTLTLLGVIPEDPKIQPKSRTLPRKKKSLEAGVRAWLLSLQKFSKEEKGAHAFFPDATHNSLSSRAQRLSWTLSYQEP